MKMQKHILLAVSGTSPAIITEAFYYLAVTRQIPVSLIQVVTTSRGRDEILQHLLQTRPGKDRPVFEQLCLDYKLKRSDVAFDRDSIRMAKDDEDLLLEDVRNDKDQQFFPNLIMTVVQELTSVDNVVVHACISGGRKAMSFYLGVAMMLYARPDDEILHVLVDREYEICRPVFYYPLPKSQKATWLRMGEEVEIDLKDGQLYVSSIPFIRLRRSFAGKGDLSYQALIRLYQKDIDEMPGLEERHYPGLFPRNGVLRDIMRRCQMLKQDDNILLTGESGIGKGALAEFIHNSSVGADQPFLKVNLAAETSQLINARLFGYVKGAFTGADRDQKSIFEAAGRGTVLLDEIDKMPLETQSRLLQLLENREFMPEGSLELKKVECKIIVAAGRDLQQLVNERNFYPDLFYRLERYLFTLPPLRERLGDIMPLTRYFLKTANGKYGKQFEDVDEALENYLIDHQWPNNIRELESCIYRLVAFNEGKILRYDFLDKKPPISTSSKLTRYDRMQRRLIEQVLADCDRNVAEAARMLELKYTTLQGKLKRLGIDEARSK